MTNRYRGREDSITIDIVMYNILIYFTRQELDEKINYNIAYATTQNITFPFQEQILSRIESPLQTQMIRREFKNE